MRATTAAHPRPGSPRVLLLTSTLGSGHLQAARAIEAALRARCPGAAVGMVDFWSLMDESVAGTARAIYLKLAEDHSDLYGRLFRLDQRAWRLVLEEDQMPEPVIETLRLLAQTYRSELRLAEPSGSGDVLDRLLFRMLTLAIRRSSRKGSAHAGFLPLAVKACWASLVRSLDERVRAFDPEVVVATEMLPAALFSALEARQTVPTVGVLTDFGMHDFWIQPGIDAYCVPHESLPGVPPAGERAFEVRATGIPLMPGFGDLPEPGAARAELGLESGRPVVLALGGGLGLGVEEVAGRLLERSSAQVLALAGRNESARRALAALAERHPHSLRSWAWTDRPELFLRAADIVVGKPGGLTVAESLACGRPFLATRSLHGQEDFNTQFLQRHEVGTLVAVEELPERVEALLADRRALGEMQRRAAAFGHPDAAARVAGAVLAHAGSDDPDPPEV